MSGSDYTGQASLFTPGVTELPPGCAGSACTPAVADGSYPGVFNNDASDPSFGVTSPIFLDQITPGGRLINTLAVPDGTGWSHGSDGHLVTSFSSKSELALNLSTSGRDITFMGYDAVPNTVDVSNANTPGDIDPTNPVAGAYYRVAAEVSADGQIRYTLTNAYSGDNGRAVILNDSNGSNVLYAAGQRGQRQQPAAGRDHHRRRRAATQAPVRAGSAADPGPAHAGRQLQHHPAGRQGRQDRQGHQLPRPDD